MLCGDVYGSEKFKNGDSIRTSTIVYVTEYDFDPTTREPYRMAETQNTIYKIYDKDRYNK